MKYIAVILLLILSSCYTRQKAATQFGKAAVTYPDIPADYCARTYPAKDSLIKGDTVLTSDTVIIAGDQFFDTVMIDGTRYITKTVQLPGKTVTNTIRLTDTVYKENKAALDLCSIERGKAIILATDMTADRDKWKKLARQRFWILTALVGGAILGLIFLVTRKKQIPLPRN